MHATIDCATRWEFRHRTWFIFGIFCVGLACYWLDPRNAGEAMATWLNAHVAFFSADGRQRAVRAIFLFGACVVVIGATIRAWGCAYLRAVFQQDAQIHTERLVADGPFRYTRNPLYFGMLLGVFGAGVLCSLEGWVLQTALAVVFVYRLIFREEAELLKTQSERFHVYCRAVPRLLPATTPRVPASDAPPHWREGFAVQLPWWGIAAANLTWAISLRPSPAFAVAGAGFVLFLGQKYVVRAYVRPHRKA